GGFRVNNQIDVRLAGDPPHARFFSSVGLSNVPLRHLLPTPPEQIWRLAALTFATPQFAPASHQLDVGGFRVNNQIDVRLITEKSRGPAWLRPRARCLR